MVNNPVVLCFLATLGVVLCYPSHYLRNGYYHPIPKRSVMFGGYYSNPMLANDYGYVPEGAMTAMVSGNTVATNSFSGVKPQWKPNPQPPVQIPQVPIEDEQENETFFEEITEKQPSTIIEKQPSIIIEKQPSFIVEKQPSIIVERQTSRPSIVIEEKPSDEALQETAPPVQEQENDEEELVVSTETAVVTSTRGPKTPKRLSTGTTSTKKRKPQKEEEDNLQDDDDEPGLPSGWPFGSRRGGPSYTAFFPISIGGAYPSAQRRRDAAGAVQDDDTSAADSGYFPGSATAIANSFSTGKGGVATSHATSFGDPYLAARFLRNLARKGGWNEEKDD